ncbi:MAG: flagellar motor switch protein FliN [Nitrosomonas sp.]|nr:flagellar motor switch protein FliN [Nitrosomonas sp.]MCW5619435.1 flagellar motor switch protein FliN [Nitrosomonas sp.]
MSDTPTTETLNAEDDWAAALAEQEATTQQTDNAENETLSDPGTDTNQSTSSNTGDEEYPQEENFIGAKKAQATVFKEFSAENVIKNTVNDIDLILDIPVQLTVELGRTKIAIKNLLQLAQGSVVELDGLAGEPMNVLVNGCLIAQGEVVVVNDKFGIRLTDVITPSERIRKLNR